MGDLDLGIGGTAQTPPPPTTPPTTQDTIDAILRRFRANAIALAGYSNVPLTSPDETGKSVATEAGAAYADLLAQQSGLEKSLVALGYDPKTLGGSRQSADSAASTGLGYARIAADKELAAQAQEAAAKQAEANRATTERGQDITTRGQNADTVISLLDKEIAAGNLSVTQAATKLRGTTDAANLERGVLADWGQYALPEGSQYFPGAGPGGVLSNLAASLGVRGLNIPTGGTFQVDPHAMAAPITAAANAVPDASGAVQSATQRAMSALAQIGMPVDSRVGRPPGQDATSRALSGMAA